jgi:hypothetical protein
LLPDLRERLADRCGRNSIVLGESDSDAPIDFGQPGRRHAIEPALAFRRLGPRHLLQPPSELIFEGHPRDAGTAAVDEHTRRPQNFVALCVILTSSHSA